jgi:hypothetical protein
MKGFSDFKMCKLYYLIIAFGCLSSCNNNRNRGSLEFIIDKSELHINHKREKPDELCMYNCVDINFRLKNTLDKNILLYNFNTYFELGEFNESLFCDSIFKSAERFVYVNRSNGKQVIPSSQIPDSISWKSLSSIEKQMELSPSWFRNTKQLIKKGETIEFTQRINLREFELKETGIFSLKLLYYQHDVLLELTKEELSQDLKKYEADLFQGCLWSNSVPLIVD